MHTPATFDAHQSEAGSALPGCWKLEAGRAVTLRPRRSGVLRIAHGRVWVTMDGPHGHADQSGDLFLVPGRGLVVQAGQRVVLESSGPERLESAYFSWDPLSRLHGQAVAHAVRGAGGWQTAVVHPLRDLGLALGQAGAAAGRLVTGVSGLAASLLPGRGRLQPHQS